MLFATLDPTMRTVRLPDGRDVILSDTVGFISDLPTQLVAAFRATLEEVLSADVVVHVRDISHPETEIQAEDVAAVLSELGLPSETPQIELWNKIDRVAPDDRPAIVTRANRKDATYVTSAITGAGLDSALAAISGALDEARTRKAIDLSFAEGRKRAWLFEQGVIEKEVQTDDGYRLTVNWTPKQAARFKRL